MHKRCESILIVRLECVHFGSIHLWTRRFLTLIVRHLVFQSALTGESLPVTKKPGDVVFSGSTCKQGEIEAVVIATGVHTFFGKAAHLVDSTHQVGHFQKVYIFPKSY